MLVGFEQVVDTTDYKLAPHLLESESGLTFQSAHPLITIQNLASIAPDYKNQTAYPYDDSTDYEEGMLVSWLMNTYRCIKPITGIEPTHIKGDRYWEVTDLFSDWLHKKTQASLNNLKFRFINEKIVKGGSKALLGSCKLFDGVGNLSNKVANEGLLVGLALEAKQTVNIKRIGLQFTTAGSYTVYLLHSDDPLPVKVMTFDRMRSSALEWFPIDIKLKPYGVYFLAYIQDKLPIDSEAIAKPVRFASAECNTCGENRWRKYLQVQPYYINLGSYERPDFNEDFNNDFANAPIRMWNLEDMVFVDHTNYGLNIELDVFCDYEEFFELNRLQFADAFRKQFAVDMLKEFAYNSNARANRFSINASKQELMFELHGSEGYKGLIAQCDDAIKSLDISTRGMNKDCFPCFGGVKYKAI